MHDEALDRAIDAVAREMTAGEPGAHLRARVTDRLRQRSGGARSRYVWSAAMTTAAIVLLALVAYRTTRPPIVKQRPTYEAVRSAAPSGRAAATAVATPPGPRGPRLHAAPAPRRIAIGPSPIDALAPPPLDVSPLATDDVAVSSIDVPPLDPIAPIEIAPLGEGDRR